VLGLPSGQAASLLLFASLAFRLTRFFLAPVLDRLPARTALLTSVALTAAGYLGLAATSGPLPLLVLLPVIGAGYGTNSLIVKALAAEGRAGTDGALLRYASINTGLNVAAAVGPWLGNLLFFHTSPRHVFLMAAGTSAAAGLLSLRQPATAWRRSGDVTWLAGLRASVANRELRDAALLLAMGFFLYSQLFATLPVVTKDLLGTPDLLGTFFAANAVIVICLQVPVSRLSLRRGLGHRQLIPAGYVLYAAGFALLWAVPEWQAAYPAVALWTLGEMVLVPSVDAMVAASVPRELRLIGFALTAVAMAVGEGAGSFFGVSLAGRLDGSGDLRHLYAVFAVLALLALGVAAATRRPRSEPTDEEADGDRHRSRAAAR
jgi:MFS family permease